MRDQIQMLWELNDTLGEKLVRLEMSINRTGHSGSMPATSLQSLNSRLEAVESLFNQLPVESTRQTADSNTFERLHAQELSLLVESLNERVRQLERDA